MNPTTKWPSAFLAVLGFLVAGAGIGANSLAAQDFTGLSLEDLMQIDIPTVVSASKFAQKTTEAPAAVTVVTRDEIQRYGWRNLGEALRSVGGFYVTYDRGYGYVGVRGVGRTRDYGGRVLLLVDGHRMNDPVYGTFSVQQDFVLDLDLVERIEVVRGPGSSLYGDNAFFGVVNVITRRGGDLDGTETALSYGSHDTASGRFSYGAQSSNGVEVVLSGSLYDSHGADDLYFPDFDNPPATDGHARDLDDETAGSLHGRVNYRGLGLGGGWVNREKQIPTARYDNIFGDPDFVAQDERGFAYAEYDGALWSQWQLLVRASYDRYSYLASYPSRNPDGSRYLNWEETVAQWLGTEFQLQRQLGERHRLTLGAEYRYTFSVDQETYNDTPANMIYASDPDFRNWGAYVQDEIRLAPWALLNAGVRFDSYDAIGSEVCPRLGLVLPVGAATVFKLLYGEAFRAPNVNELYYQNGTDVRDVNPNLGPETIATYEAIWEQQFGRGLRTSLSAFRNEIRDILEFDATSDLVDTFAYVNSGDADITGGEAQIEIGRSEGVRGRASYALANVDRPEGAEPFDNSPEHLAKFNLIVPLGTEKCTAGLEAQYVGARLGDGGGDVPAGWVANATLFAQPFGDDFDLAVGLYNLLDEDYADPAYGTPTQVPQNGRTFRVKATVRF